jgi:hypothetical protein
MGNQKVRFLNNCTAMQELMQVIDVILNNWRKVKGEVRETRVILFNLVVLEYRVLFSACGLKI